MTKNQKLWFWIGLALFAIPEILFSFLVGSIASVFGKATWSIYLSLVGQQFIVDHQAYLFVALIVECVGVALVLIGNIKYSPVRVKNVFTALLTLLLLALLLVLYVGYAVSNISPL